MILCPTPREKEFCIETLNTELRHEINCTLKLKEFHRVLSLSTVYYFHTHDMAIYS